MWGENKKQETPPPPTRPLTSGAATGTATATAIAERPAPAEPEETIMSINTVEANRPAVVHCASANRVGALLLPHLVLDEGRTEADAIATARAIGLRSQELLEAALTYLHDEQEKP